MGAGSRSLDLSSPFAVPLREVKQGGAALNDLRNLARGQFQPTFLVPRLKLKRLALVATCPEGATHSRWRQSAFHRFQFLSRTKIRKCWIKRRGTRHTTIQSVGNPSGYFLSARFSAFSSALKSRSSIFWRCFKSWQAAL